MTARRKSPVKSAAKSVAKSVAKRDVALGQAYRLMNPGSVVLVTVGDGERESVFPVTWNMVARQEPSMVALLVGKENFSYSLIRETSEFGVNIPHAGLVDAVMGCGSCSGREVTDKFKRFGLTRLKSQHIAAPLVSEAVACLECEVAHEHDMGHSSLILGYVVRAVADPRYFSQGRWVFGTGLKLIHHLSGNQFCVSEQLVKANLPRAEEASE